MAPMAKRPALARAPAPAPSSVRLLRCGASARPRRAQLALAAADGTAVKELQAPVSPKAPPVGSMYCVTLEKPLGIKWARGNDGKAYIKALFPSIGSLDEQMTPGDKILRCSASFGDDIWDAENYGQVMYAVKQRNGAVYLEMEARGGDLAIFEFDEVDDITKMQMTERNGGNVGMGTREKQRRNYEAAQERAKARIELFEQGLKDYQANDFEKALVAWEEVVGMEPPNYIDDSGQRFSQVLRVTQFNIACVYSRLENMDEAFEALERCLKIGFEDYKMVRNDPALENLRKEERFTELINKYDEPLFNENVLKGFKSLFGGGN